MVERELVDLLRKKSLTLVLIESCTGGGIADRLTRVPGSSDVLWGSLVTYQERAKTRVLGITRASLKRHGAVSPETAAAMARAGLSLGGKRVIAVSTTGVAGPGGGSRRTPVGLCYIGVASSRSRGRARVVRVAPSSRRISRAAQKRRFALRALAEALKEAQCAR